MIYNFDNQNLISYQDNFRAKGDIPLVVYFDFVVSYVTIVAFHPELKLNRIVIQRNYTHSKDQLTSLNYFTQEQISFIDHTLLKMLKDMAFDVSKRKCKNSMGQMFCIESALAKKAILMV